MRQIMYGGVVLACLGGMFGCAKPVATSDSQPAPSAQEVRTVVQEDVRRDEVLPNQQPPSDQNEKANLQSAEKESHSTAIPASQDSPEGSLTITPSTTEQKRASAVNLLAPENGGTAVLASGKSWSALLKGIEKQYMVKVNDHVVYALHKGQLTMVDTVAVQFPEVQGQNVKEFDVSISTKERQGPYTSVGVFHTKNNTDEQTFIFAPVKAKYVKFTFLSAHDGGKHIVTYPLQVFGQSGN